MTVSDLPEKLAATNAIPAMTVAVGLILVWNQAFWPWTPYNTWWVMLLAYTCIMLPYPVRMITSTLRQLPMSMQDAAVVYGASDLGVILRVNGPALLGVSVASGFIVFSIASRELVTSLLLTPPGFETVSTFVFHQFDQGSVNTAMAMSIVSVAISGSFIALGHALNRFQAMTRNKARRADVRTIAPTTLLRLNEQKFRRLLERSTALQQALKESAEKRGIDIDELLHPEV